ncbi:hypothetical protein AgCh_028473 [Apium graveolens]
MLEDFKNSNKTANVIIVVISQVLYEDDRSNRPTRGLAHSSVEPGRNDVSVFSSRTKSSSQNPHKNAQRNTVNKHVPVNTLKATPKSKLSKGTTPVKSCLTEVMASKKLSIHRVHEINPGTVEKGRELSNVAGNVVGKSSVNEQIINTKQSRFVALEVCASSASRLFEESSIPDLVCCSYIVCFASIVPLNTTFIKFIMTPYVSEKNLVGEKVVDEYFHDEDEGAFVEESDVHKNDIIRNNAVIPGLCTIYSDQTGILAIVFPDDEIQHLIGKDVFKVENDDSQEFSAPGTPQQNGVVERKNRTLIEAARTMLDEAKLPTYFLAEAVQTSYFTQNATLINKHGKTPYEMVKKKKPNLKYFHVFGCKCFVLKTHPEQLPKFDLKADEGIFVGYPLSTKAFKVYNLRTRVVMESINVSFDDKKITGLEDFNDHVQLRFENEDLNSDSVNSDNLNLDPVSSDELNSDFIETMITTPRETAPVQGEQAEDPTTTQDSQEASEPVTGSSSSDSSCSDEPNSDNSGNSDSSIPEGSNSNSKILESITSGEHQKMLMETAWIMGEDPAEPKKMEEALQDADWVQAMQKELNEFGRNKVWTLVPRPKNISIVGTKWVFRNKTDSDGIITRNKARLVAKGYSQHEGIDYDETFAQLLDWKP